MEDFKRMYLHMFNAVTDVLWELEQNKVYEAKTHLISAQQACEEMYIRGSGSSMKVPKSELAILEILWSAGVPLTRCEIRERLEEPTKDAVVSILLNNLRDKKLIRGAGYVRSAGDWCRRYKPRVTREEIEG